MVSLHGDEEGERKEKEYAEKSARVKIFPGSKAEYEQLKGYEVEIIEMEQQNLGLTIWRVINEKNYEITMRIGEPIRDYLIEQNLEAIVWAKHANWDHPNRNWPEPGDLTQPNEDQTPFKVIIGYYGLPVRRKREK